MGLVTLGGLAASSNRFRIIMPTSVQVRQERERLRRTSYLCLLIARLRTYSGSPMASGSKPIIDSPLAYAKLE